MRDVKGRLALVGLLVALAPPLRQWLESSMLVHMLVQLPMIAAAGAALGAAMRRAVPASLACRAASVDAGGACGILFASAVMVLWMLPRSLDAARLDLAVDAVKFVSVAAAGAAVALSWPRCPPIGRGVVHLEAMATLARFGWGYLAAGDRLCASYLLADQQTTGTALLMAAAAWAVVVGWRPMFGRGDARLSAEVR
jgi:hypothetical protein